MTVEVENPSIFIGKLEIQERQWFIESESKRPRSLPKDRQVQIENFSFRLLSFNKWDKAHPHWEG